jgi:hypothetical protein
MTTRQDRLNRLKQAVTDWHQKEKQRIEDEVAFLRSISEGRSEGNLSRRVTEFASALIETEINSFLESD